MRGRLKTDRHRVVLAILALVAAALPLAVTSRAEAMQVPAVAINEFMAANTNTLSDNTGSFEDWVELHNPTGSSADLGGWVLQDSGESFTFPAGFTVPANGYRVVFASGDTSRSTGSELHLPFKLRAAGEPLSLRDAIGTLTQPSWPAPGFPPLPTDVSFGVTAAGGLGYFSTPTPGSANSSASNGIVSAVSFSLPHGFYSADQAVTLNTTTTGATIRYTLDGSTPTATSGTALTPGQSIAINQTSTVRAIAYRTGWIASTVETRSYLFADDIIEQPESRPPGWPRDNDVNDAAFDYGMDPNIVDGNEAAVAASLMAIPSLSVVTDQANLTGESDGIYVNPWNSGINWERPVSIELIDPTGAEPGFDINAGLRIRGGGSRTPDNPKHSFRLYFRDDYGDGNLEYPLFGPDGAQSFESLGLATGQHGSWTFRGEDYATWIREMWSRETQLAMGQPHTDSRFYHLYLNGQYWGLYYSQERVSNGFGVERFGGNEGDYDVITANWRSAGTATDGTIDAWQSLYPMLADLNVTDTEYNTLVSLVDLDNLADYYVLHFFSGDWDGSPMGWTSSGVRFADSNNWRALRNRAAVGAAGRWIFFDHDSEFTLCSSSSPVDVDNTDWNLSQGTVPDHQVPTPAWLHESLLTHPAYRQIFRDRVALHMQTAAGALTPGVSQARVDALANAVRGAIDGEAARWGDSLGNPAYDRDDWEANVAVLRQCAADRFAVVRSQLQSDGLWPGENPPLISPAAGPVPFGATVSIDANGEPGTIWFTTDGTDPRAIDGAPASTAVEYTGPLQVTAAVTVRARVLSGSTWTPLAESSYTLSSGAGPVRLALNEYNAVGAGKFLGGGAQGDLANGSDATFGRVAGNGGDWFELVVIEDELDIRGWTLEVWHLANGLLERSAALTFADRIELQALEAGTIITISEDIADDLGFDPLTNDWHINLQANNADQGQFITASSQKNFAIDNDNTQIAIFDAAGLPVALRTGEGTVPGISVSSEEVFKLEATPTTTLTSDSTDYADGTSSTWGLPNQWAGGTVTQDLWPYRTALGDVTCDGEMTIADALVIAQYSVGTRQPTSVCPMDLATEIMVVASDVNRDDSIDIADALLIAQCQAGLVNVACPEAAG